jgi:hypothetical protein
MHKNEQFLTTLDEEGLLQVMFEAQSLGKAHVAALKEQFTRLEIKLA